MKNRMPFAALTFAFTVAGGALGHSLANGTECAMVVLAIAAVGGLAAAISGEDIFR